LYVCQEGMPPKALLQNMPYTVESFRWKPDGQSLFLVVTQGAHRAFGEFSLKDKKLSRRTSPPWEVAFRSSYSLSRDGSRVAGILARDREPPDVWLLDANGSQKQLTHLNPQLSSCRFGESSEVKWQSRDGLGISGVLLKPVGYEPGKRVPMVVQVHGSQVADVNEFQGTWMNWGQLLAARGYAVLLPNYRGSLTDGASFARANQGDLGGKDFEDIMDGVDAMVQQGIADPERLGIGGVSYGGFLTAWAVTQTSRFKAAVMGLGISNWISMAGQTPGHEGMVRFYWLSSPYERSDLFWRRSPLAQVSKVKTPVLIYAGERDPLVPVSQSREFFRGLQHFAVPSQFILYPREGHSIQEPNHLRDNLNRLLDWYDRYLKSSS
jgi:dipeptidyl aminopeptidase/acylaminoacyl peptidase